MVDPMAIEKDSGTLKSGTGAKSGESLTYDGELYVDKLTGVYLSGTRHEEDQPCHLQVLDMDICLNQCRETYRNPCTRFCPGQVYEMEEEGGLRLKLNPSNCLHCKTCEIKDPYDNIIWTCPEGGGGPNYSIV
jgi:electron-transferring-flavoprotein dehydrogenase